MVYSCVMTKDKWITQYRKGIYELAILMLLNKKDMYGYFEGVEKREGRFIQF
ncbi:hypothetical protein J32TS2_19600 [Shouchella clausii]|nr:hypothetical protein J32TS2_19600 [Shouchella clausii]